MKRLLLLTLFACAAGSAAPARAQADPASDATSPPRLSGSLSTDLLIRPVVNNALDAGEGGPANLTLRPTLTYDTGRGTLLLADDYRHIVYPFTDQYGARSAGQVDNDLRLGFGAHSLYVGGSYLSRRDNQGTRVGGFGFGGQYEASLQRSVAPYASLYYYPSVSGTGPVSGVSYAYHVTRGSVGAKVPLKKTRAFFDLGMDGERGRSFAYATANSTETSPYAGLGFHF